jgi:hypothetical protein
LVRASVFGLVGLMGAWSPFAVMASEARRASEVAGALARPAAFWPAVWVSALFVVVLCGAMAWRIAREAFPPQGTTVFQVVPVQNVTVVDVVVAPVALLLMLVLGLFPRMWVDPMGGFGLRAMDVMQLFVIAPMGAALLLWRPSYHVANGQPIVRYPAGAWLPWKKLLPMRPKLEWRDFWANKPPRQIGWGLHAVMGRFELFLELVDLNASQELKDRVQSEWTAFFAGVKQGTPEEIAAALANDKPVKPWHLMAAMFGLPATPLAVTACFQKHYDAASMGIALLLVTVAGGLALWFLSRFVSEKVLTGLIALLAAISITGVLTGRNNAQASALSNRLGYQITDVCDGKPAREPTSPSEPLRFAYAEGSRYRLSSADDTLLTGMPRAVGCLGWSRGQNVTATVTLRSSATGEVLTTRTFPEGTRLDAMASELSGSLP